MGDKVLYRGTMLSAGGLFKNVTLFRSDPSDYYKLIGGNILDFSFLTDGFEDGLNWKTTGGGLVMTLKMNGKIAAPNIALGSQPFGTVQAFTFYLAP